MRVCGEEVGEVGEEEGAEFGGGEEGEHGGVTGWEGEEELGLRG